MKPRTDYPDKVHGAIQELIGAQSALNMTPSPKSEDHIDAFEERYGREPEYLSETDHWAEHAAEHLDAAIRLLKAHRTNTGATLFQPNPTSFGGRP